MRFNLRHGDGQPIIKNLKIMFNRQDIKMKNTILILIRTMRKNIENSAWYVILVENDGSELTE